MVRVPAKTRTSASSDRRRTDFSSSGSVEPRILWKIVACDKPLLFVLTPVLMSFICFTICCFHYHTENLVEWRDNNILFAVQKMQRGTDERAALSDPGEIGRQH